MPTEVTPEQAARAKRAKASAATRQIDALLETRLGALRQNVDAFFAAGGKPGEKDRSPRFNRDLRQQGVEKPKRIVHQLKRLASDSVNPGKLRPGGTNEFRSGFKRRVNIANEAVELLDKLRGGNLADRIQRADPKSKLGKKQNDRSFDDFGSFAYALSQGIKRQRGRQRDRNARVAETGAQQRNNLANRRNLSLSPGTKSQLRSSTAGLFAEQRRGVII